MHDPAPPHPRQATLADKAKAVLPRGVKSLLKPVVRPFLHHQPVPSPTALPASRRRPHNDADHWTDNRWTIRTPEGRTHTFFFITGCYKSGTNWVQNLLNLHPAVNSKGEFHFEALWRGYTELTGTPWYLSAKPNLAEVAAESAYDTVRRMIYTQTRDKPEATWLGDRTPRPLAEFLPGAPTVRVQRDGRDVMVSWNFHHLRVKDPARFRRDFQPAAAAMCPAFQADPASFERRGAGFLSDEKWFRHHARVWSDTILADAAEAPLFRERGTPLLELRYEDIHRDVHEHAGWLYAFLGLDPAIAAAPSYENRTLPGFQNSSPAKFYRKGAMGEWRDYFEDYHVRWFKEEAGRALVVAGYEPSDNWSLESSASARAGIDAHGTPSQEHTG